jgi:acyl-CoA synthetase (AMP-forming)/AMP-acid ligase II
LTRVHLPAAGTEARDFALAHTYGGAPFGSRLPIIPSIPDLLRRRARVQGAAPFVTEVSAGGEATTLTFAEAESRSAALAGWLRGEAGVRPGDVVGLIAANDLASITAVFAILRLGCSVLFLNRADPPARIAQQTGALAARVVVRSPAVHEAGGAAALPLRAGWAPAGGAPGAETPADPLADAFFFGTSGSTAASKLVAQAHYNAAVNAEAVRRHHRIGPRDVLLAVLPLHHVNALHLTLFGTLAGGAHVVFAHAFDPFGYARLLERFAPRIASVAPSLLEALLATWRGRALPGGFGYFVSAAAPLAARTARGVSERMGARVMQGYGLTETVNFSTTLPPDLSADAYRRLMLDAEIPSVGVALYGNEVAVLGPDGARVPPGVVGEVCIRGHNVMMRYAGNPEATAEAFRGGWFHTQDLGYETGAGAGARRYLVLTGRTRNIAKVRGESVSLDEMDRVMKGVPLVEDCAAVAVPDDLLGEKVVVGIVGPDPLSEAEVRAALAAAFPAAVLPRRIVRMDAIPRTPTGKILRPELARLLSAEAGS